MNSSSRGSGRLAEPASRAPAACALRILAILPAVATKLDEAEDQAHRYGTALRERYGLTDLRCFAVVALGLERVVWRAVG